MPWHYTAGIILIVEEGYDAMDIRSDALVTDEIWAALEPMLPNEGTGSKGGRPRLPNREALAGILYVLRADVSWMRLPAEVGCGAGVTCWRRLCEWQRFGVWERVEQELRQRLSWANEVDWERAWAEGVGRQVCGTGTVGRRRRAGRRVGARA
jgi:transposase